MPFLAAFVLAFVNPQPLPALATFDQAVNMPATRTAGATRHFTRDAASLAAGLVANGAPRDLALAVKVLDSVLECQERHASDAHYGNFRWARDDAAVEDLNAVEFVLADLIPMMQRYRNRLPPDLRSRVLESIRLGLREMIVMDGANIFHAGELPRMHALLGEAFDLLGPDIALAHAKDLSRDGEAGQQAAGTGVLDYDRYLSLLRASGYDGPLLLHSLEEAQVADSVTFLRGKLATLR